MFNNFEKLAATNDWWSSTLLTLQSIAERLEDDKAQIATHDANIIEGRRNVNRPQFLRRLEEIDCADERQALTWQHYMKRANLLSAVLGYYQYRENTNRRLEQASQLLRQIAMRIKEVDVTDRETLTAECVRMLKMIKQLRRDPKETLDHLSNLNAVPHDIFYDAMDAIFQDQRSANPTFDLESAECGFHFIEIEDFAGGSEQQRAFLTAQRASKELKEAVKRFHMSKGSINAPQYAKRLEEASLAQDDARFNEIMQQQKISQGECFAAAVHLSDCIKRLSASVDVLEAAFKDVYMAVDKIASHILANNLILARKKGFEWRSQLETASRLSSDISMAKSRIDPVRLILDMT